ncbi:MAG: hypothetical protein ABEJ56_00210 [Candidatus Nanohaloarchaea archaeon]
MGEIKDWGREKPLFNLNEAQRQLKEDRSYLKTKIQRAVQKGDLKRIERNKYTLHDDPLIYASHIEKPSYISLWSGLRYYDLTTQTPRKIDVMTPVDRKDLDNIRFYYTQDMFGYKKKRYKGIEIFMAEKEKLLIDCLSRKQVAVSELIELVEEVEIDKLVELAERTGKKSVKKRLGFLFEKLRDEEVEEFMVEDTNYTPLELSQPAEGEKNPDWMVLVNTDAL